MRAGRLHLLHRGVYAVGHRSVTPDGRRFAAVFACGPGAVLSHASAAAAWELRQSSAALIDVTVDRAGRARRAGIRLHRSGTLTRADTTTVRGIPITTPLRTVLDLAAAGVKGRRLERVLDRAEQHRLIDFAALRQAIEAHPRRPGSPSLQAVLSRYAVGSVMTRSELEEAFLELCDRAGLPRPNVNTGIEEKESDFSWPPLRLVVEVDGFDSHGTRAAFEEDRERDVLRTLAGWRVLRFTWAQVLWRSSYVENALRRALGPT